MSARALSKSFVENLDPRNVYKSFITSLGYEPDDPESSNGYYGQENGHLSLFHPTGIDTHPSQLKTQKFYPSKFELNSTKVAIDERETTESIRCLWPFLRLSRLIGMCPITRQKDYLVVTRYYHPSWILTWIALTIQFLMVLNAVNQTTNAKSTDDMIKHANKIIYYAHTLTNGIYMSWRIKEFPNFLISCKKIETICRKHYIRQSKQPDRLVRDCFLFFLLFSITQAIGNILYLLAIGNKGNAKSIGEFFHSYSSEFTGNWGTFYTGMFFCFGELYCDMGWGFADILLALISVVLARFFVRLNCILGTKGVIFTYAQIEELRADHSEICQLVELCNKLFSPIFFITYVANVGYLFTRLYTGFSDDLQDPVLAVRIESIYAFLFQIFIKILTPSYLASRLNEQAQEGLELIHSWPSAVNMKDSKQRLLVINRFLTQIVTTQVGISGCGYFIINKSFLVTLISALVTYEVIILQFQATNLQSEH